MTTPSFEQGPIRPPSEAHSLLVRVIRNCTWNRCTFCPVYKGTKASQRSLDEVLARRGRHGGGGRSSGRRRGRRGPDAVRRSTPGRSRRRRCRWRSSCGTALAHVFLQDADPCAVQPDKLAAILEHLRRRFPTIARVTTYGRAATIARRPPGRPRAARRRRADPAAPRSGVGCRRGAGGRLQGGHLEGADRGRPQGADGRPRAVLLRDARPGRPRAERGAHSRHCPGAARRRLGGCRRAAARRKTADHGRGAGHAARRPCGRGSVHVAGRRRAGPGAAFAHRAGRRCAVRAAQRPRAQPAAGAGRVAAGRHGRACWRCSTSSSRFHRASGPSSRSVRASASTVGWPTGTTATCAP